MSLLRLLVCLCIIVITIAGSSSLYADTTSNNLLSTSNTNVKYAQNQIINIKGSFNTK